MTSAAPPFPAIPSLVVANLQIINSTTFTRMARGDLASLKELAADFFADTHRLLAGWTTLLETGNHSQLRRELHRCKGGASLFGLERLVALIGYYEESQRFQPSTFEQELVAAEQAVITLASLPS